VAKTAGVLTPKAGRPKFPDGYGIPKDTKGVLPWSWVEERMVKARNYWVGTTRPDGQPHARPVDGVWVEGALCFGGAPTARWARNLEKNAAMTVHLGSETDVVILEGTAEWITDKTNPIVAPMQAESKRKYPEYYGSGASAPPFAPFWMLRPRVAYAWTLEKFPASATRWNLATDEHR
jgi:general stress protein 26